MANMKAKTGHPHDASKYLPQNYNKQTQLNTYIYEYFLHNSMFQCAQSILKADSDVKVQRHSPGGDRHDKGLQLKNALRNKTIDSRLDSTHSNLLPAPNVPNLPPDSCFLYEWFGLFWAMFNAQKNEDGRIEACQYACHIQQRNWQKWNVSWPQTQSSSLLLQAPGSATHNAFYNSGEMGAKFGTQPMNDITKRPGNQWQRKKYHFTRKLSKAAREKSSFPKGTIPKKRTMNVKDEMVLCKIPKLNVGSTATRPANAAQSAVSHINPVGISKDVQTSSLSQTLPTGQPEVALPLTAASMAANPPVDLVQSAALNMENCNMTVNPVLCL
uniref:LisH domain-containing protein n=1 Tax=Fusarium oxysporum (strain Fo5176) TaxID=660025 RepID=A0A0D2XT59_FUSOF